LSYVDDELVAIRRVDRDGQTHRRTRLVERDPEDLENRDAPVRWQVEE